MDPKRQFVVEKERPDLSIIIPAKNEAANIKRCLKALFNQKTEYRFEIIVIDSGSTDNTVELIRKFPVQLVEIAAGQFGHGKTRNLGAQLAQGDYLVYLNADAVPVGKLWLNKLIDRFATSEKIAGVFSRHLPKPGCYQYMVRDLLASMPLQATLRSAANAMDLMIFSTVSCAIKKKVWKEFPFDDDILIAEDQKWARTVLDRHYKIAYEPASQVKHSHNYSSEELFVLKFKVGRSTSTFKSKFSAVVMGFVLMVGGIIVKSAGDLVFILIKNRAGLSFPIGLKQLKIAFFARIAAFRGRYAGWIYASKQLTGDTKKKQDE